MRQRIENYLSVAVEEDGHERDQKLFGVPQG